MPLGKYNVKHSGPVFLLALAVCLILPGPEAARAEPELICQIAADARTGAVLSESGDCDRRTTPASTFKLPLAVMAFDSGLLEGPHAPAWTWAEGEPDWVEGWRGTQTPTDWMRKSVVWYSQRLTRQLGAQRFAAYLAAMDYGNADASGDPGQDNGLERAWLTSSLQISPREQTRFLTRLVTGDLAAAPEAMQQAMNLAETWEREGWRIAGKTGAAFPRRPDGSFDYERGYGWFVGWARRDDRLVVFARLAQNRARTQVPASFLVRDALLESWPEPLGGAR